MNRKKGTVGVQYAQSVGDSKRLGVNDTRFWEKRIQKRAYRDISGKPAETPEWYLRIKQGGRSVYFCLHSANRTAAANLARQIGLCVRVEGLDVAEARFKEQGIEPIGKLTIGDFLKAVASTNRLEPRTFLGYSNCLRTICAGVFGMRDGREKFDYRLGGSQRFRERIDRIQLERLTADAVSRWARERIANSSGAPEARASARRTVNNYIRSARSLFSTRRRNGNPSLLEDVAKLLPSPLPKELPFSGVGLFDSGSMQFKSDGSRIPGLWIAAKRDLADQDPDCFKVFLLASLGGLRRGEIDGLEWRMVDLNKGVIHLEQTEWLRLKSDDSRRNVALDREVVEELVALHRDGSQFVVDSSWRARTDSVRRYYRCQPVFDRLIDWLKSNGIASQKPLHELRKEVGALIATREGIYAASHFLGHSDITTTARHYAAMQRPVTAGIGALLKSGSNTSTRT